VTASHLNMVLDQVDANDHVIGIVPRREVFKRKANFRVVHILLSNAHGQLLLQKIAEGRRHAGQWGSSVAGYFRKGETRASAAKRKLREELGIQAATLAWVGKTAMVDEGALKFIYLATVTYDGPIRMEPEHASGLEFLSLDELAEIREHGLRRLTATFVHVLDFYLQHRRR
jgi:isopentenyl-diphosphate delta-isomerase